MRNRAARLALATCCLWRGAACRRVRRAHCGTVRRAAVWRMLHGCMLHAGRQLASASDSRQQAACGRPSARPVSMGPVRGGPAGRGARVRPTRPAVSLLRSSCRRHHHHHHQPPPSPAMMGTQSPRLSPHPDRSALASVSAPTSPASPTSISASSGGGGGGGSGGGGGNGNGSSASAKRWRAVLSLARRAPASVVTARRPSSATSGHLAIPPHMITHQGPPPAPAPVSAVHHPSHAAVAAVPPSAPPSTLASPSASSSGTMSEGHTPASSGDQPAPSDFTAQPRPSPAPPAMRRPASVPRFNASSSSPSEPQLPAVATATDHDEQMRIFNTALAHVHVHPIVGQAPGQRGAHGESFTLTNNGEDNDTVEVLGPVSPAVSPTSPTNHPALPPVGTRPATQSQTDAAPPPGNDLQRWPTFTGSNVLMNANALSFSSQDFEPHKKGGNGFLRSVSRSGSRSGAHGAGLKRTNSISSFANLAHGGSHPSPAVESVPRVPSPAPAEPKSPGGFSATLASLRNRFPPARPKRKGSLGSSLTVLQTHTPPAAKDVHGVNSFVAVSVKGNSPQSSSAGHLPLFSNPSAASSQNNLARPYTPSVGRRTYSASSITVAAAEVGPGSFNKIKMLGKGDVGKVYMVREKKSEKLYAMKGTSAVASLRSQMTAD